MGDDVTQPPCAPRPNILWIIADQWRSQATGYHGDPNAVTPNLDRLASQGVDFVQAVSAHPLCVPFRGALLTGQHAHVNCVTGHYSALPAGTRTIAHELENAGYDTAWFGKWHLYEHVPADQHAGGDWVAQIVVPEDRRGGFTHWEAFEGGNVMHDPWLHTDTDPTPNRRCGYQPDVLVDAIATWLQQRRASRPFFAVVSVEPPHDPYDVAPEPYLSWYDPTQIVLRPNVPRAAPVEPKARRDLAGYYAHIAATDAAIGRLLKELDQLALADHTIVVFMADHGDLLGSHGLYMKTRPLEEAIRIPLLMRWPSHIPPGHQSDALISEIDLWPTICGLAGLPLPRGIQGRDLSNEARGENGGGPTAVLLQHVDGLGHPDGTRLPWRAVRTVDAMFGCTIGQEEWLYNLAEDPFQVRNLALVGGARELRAQMRSLLQEVLDRYEDPFPLPPAFEPEHGGG